MQEIHSESKPTMSISILPKLVAVSRSSVEPCEFVVGALRLEVAQFQVFSTVCPVQTELQVNAADITTGFGRLER
jgi:hypothetical protein